jgi:hypothetical protein
MIESMFAKVDAREAADHVLEDVQYQAEDMLVRHTSVVVYYD